MEFDQPRKCQHHSEIASLANPSVAAMPQDILSMLTCSCDDVDACPMDDAATHANALASYALAAPQSHQPVRCPTLTKMVAPSAAVNGV